MSKRSLIEVVKQAFCEHEFEVLYLDSKFRVENEVHVHQWVCRCKKCGKDIRVDSSRSVL